MGAKDARVFARRALNLQLAHVGRVELEPGHLGVPAHHPEWRVLQCVHRDVGREAAAEPVHERDITGHVRVITFTTQLQLETFSSALFWAYCFRTVGLVASEHEEDSEWYQQMPTRWRNVIEVLKGAQGQFKIPNSEIFFNPDEKDLQVMSKAYGHVRLMLEQVWACTLKGWFSKKEPFTAPSE